MLDLPPRTSYWQFDESERLAALQDLEILNTPCERAFDDLAHLACRLFDVPIALISLIDDQRQWFKSTVGTDICETALDDALGVQTMRTPDGIVVEDAKRDPNVSNSLLVAGSPCIRFYAGMPLYGANKLPIGTLCIISPEPREFAPKERLILERLADLASLLIIQRKPDHRRPGDAKGRLSLAALTERTEQHFLKGMPPRLVLREILDGLLALTSSEFGFVASCTEESSTQTFHVEGLSAHHVTPLIQELFITAPGNFATDTAHPSLNGAPFGRVVRLLSNDDLSHPLFKKLLAPALQVNAALAIPLFDSHVMNGVLILANPTQTSNPEQDGNLMAPLQALGSRLIHAIQAERLMKALAASLEEVHATLSVSADLVMIIDERSRSIRYANQGAADLLNCDRANLMRRDPCDLVEDGSALATVLAQVQNEAVERIDISLLTPEGPNIPAQAAIQRIRHKDSGQVNLVMVARDLRDTLQAQRKIDWINEHDALSGLLNRHGFLHQLKQRLAREKRGRLSRHYIDMVLVLGVDRFRRINEAHGTANADAILVALSERLVSLLLDHPEALLARLGGDEFAIALNVSDEHEACRIIQWAQQSIDDTPFSLPSRHEVEQLHVTASAGIALHRNTPGDSSDAGELLRQANAALRRAKNQGRGSTYHYLPGMLDEENRHQHIEQRLAGAHERCDLYLHYQPIWRLEDLSSPTGAEALLRWRDDELGQIGPDLFVPILEENGDMLAIGRWILASALDAMAACQSRRPDHFVSVNVSAVQLMNDDDLASFVIDSLKRRGLPASALEIEVTETALIQSPGRVKRQLHDLHQAGISIALDDFGTGFSSLSHLKQFPFDTVKIDRSFIAGLPHSVKDRAIVESLMRLCQGFERHVCAEGIETLEQLDYLRDLGCDRAQGYALGKPTPQLQFRKNARENDKAAKSTLA
ncbi:MULTISPECIES: EAL domain-containing protein [Halomonadaceae]|uniref:bifunctional diguanylate cyclase/phosphodiesterase n=1 Tax=Halomonadaceae TaxID=28256 RepID=UPI00159B461A|nr:MULTISPECIES: EAL domain-containing protein [Halomonas]QJQ94392.1 EAL domain-containing protein [Halomonas sp. PA5]